MPIDVNNETVFSGMYFACVMLMTALSVAFTILVLNYHHRSPDTHDMPTWVSIGQPQTDPYYCTQVSYTLTAYLMFYLCYILELEYVMHCDA